jgi:hypothetical protein
VNIRLVPITVVVAATMAITACATSAAAGATSATSARPAAAKPAHAAPVPIRDLGVFEPTNPRSYRQVQNFGRAIGRQPNIVQYYSGWWENFRSGFARTARAHGATVFVDMDPYHVSVAGIAAGTNDKYLKNFARQVRNFGHNVIISFGHEPNGPWYPWGYTHTSAATWVRAWRHVVNVFRAAGAKNVTWLWIVNTQVQARKQGPIKNWWPGASYVTWAGIDGYYERPGQTFASVFLPMITSVRRLSAKPVLISETAIGQGAGQTAKLPGLFAGIRARHLLGLVWFDQAQNLGVHHQDWRLEGHPAALAAFRRGLHG